MRNIININKNWKFIQKNVGLPTVYPTDWQTVDLPHSWNAVDGCDGNGSYDRGTYWYAKTFETPKQPLSGGRVFVEILAAGQQASVYVNGSKVTYHEGGYSIFRADITDLCKDGEENLLVVECSNEYLDCVYPQNADFTFYGGLYRGVSRHQDIMYKGPALSKEGHYNDAMIIKELGANTIRLAHYQYSQDFYDACDELGFANWAEIPFISVMNKEPMVHIAGKRYAQRAGETTEIKVYSNLDSVALYLNGELLEEKATVDRIAKFEVALKDGANILLAAAGDVKDSATIEKVETEPEIYTLGQCYWKSSNSRLHRNILCGE